MTRNFAVPGSVCFGDGRGFACCSTKRFGAKAELSRHRGVKRSGARDPPVPAPDSYEFLIPFVPSIYSSRMPRSAIFQIAKTKEENLGMLIAGGVYTFASVRLFRLQF